MQYAIELYFDPKTEEKLWELPRKIAAEHISAKYLEWKTRPHLTLACFNNVNEMQCIEQLQLGIIQCRLIFAQLECFRILKPFLYRLL